MQEAMSLDSEARAQAHELGLPGTMAPHTVGQAVQIGNTRSLIVAIKA